MNIRVYAHEPGPVSKAILQVVGLFEEVSGDHAIDDADVIFVTEREHINALYRKDKNFCFILTQSERKPNNLPENVFVLSAITLLNDKSGVTGLIEWLKPRLENVPMVSEKVQKKYSDLPIFRQKYHVLVVDNDYENRALAMDLLQGHPLSVEKSVQDAVSVIDQGHYDVVLTDMQMPADRLYGSLSPDAVNPALDTPYGFAMIFEATKRGIPVAVVTDANHHQDWVSAMFDHIHEATVNGQKVLFFNHIGKRWDLALKSLMES